MKSPLVYIVLLNYNGHKDTIECVKSLREINYDNFKIVIVDNASTDNSESILRTELSDTVIIQSGNNSGFAGGNNVGIRYALDFNPEYILLINTDTIVEPDFLDNMVSTFEKHGDAGIIGCKIRYFTERTTLWYGGGYVNWFKFSGVHEDEGELDSKIEETEREISFITGCSMLIKREVFEKCGLLPEEYFMYLEDLDYCVNVRENGFKLIYNPNAVIYHKVSVSTGGEGSPFSEQWGTRNRLIFMNKYKYKVSKSAFIYSKVFFYASRLYKYIRFMLRNEKKKAKAIVEGVKQGRSYIRSRTFDKSSF